MTTTTLHNYLREIDGLLENNEFAVVTQHCRYILQHYPRHLDTYRTLGKAYLEQHRLADAIDIFQRVLSADPNDFLAHAGLAIAYKYESLLPNAVWHMERAYEMEPYNMAVREELLALYQVSQSSEPEHIGATRSSLAHFYVKGELYEQAVSEIRQLLADDPERVDLELLLVESLWQMGQRLEVNERCLQILEKLPYCLVANALMAHIWLQNDMPDEAQPYLQRVQELMQFDQSTVDPETVVGWLFAYASAPPLPEQRLIEPLDDLSITPLEPEVEATSDWIEETETEEAGVYAWLSESFTDELGATIESSDPEGITAVTGEDEETAVEPDWFFDKQEEEDGLLADEEADWLADIAFEDEETADSLLTDDDANWLADLKEAADSPVAEPEPARSMSDEMPDWLDVDEAEFEPEQVDPSLVGDWVQGFAEDDDWLEQLDDEQAGLAAGLPAVDFDSHLSDDWLTTDTPLPLHTTGRLSEPPEPPASVPLADTDDEDLEESALSWLMTGPLQADDDDVETAATDAPDLDWLIDSSLEMESRPFETVDEPVDDQAWSEAETVTEDAAAASIDDEPIPDWLMTGPFDTDVLPVPADEESTAWDETSWDVNEEGVPDWLMTVPLDADEVADERDQLDFDETADAEMVEEEIVPEEVIQTPPSVESVKQTDLAAELEEDDNELGELFADWDGLDHLARSDESVEVIDSWLLKLQESDEGQEDEAHWMAEDDEALAEHKDAQPLTDLLTSELLEEPPAADLPDWLLYHEHDTETPPTVSSSDLIDLSADIHSGELTGDDLGLLPDWLLRSEPEMSDTDRETTTDQPSEKEEPVEKALADDPLLNLPDWLVQTDSGLLVGSDEPTDVEADAIAATDDVLAAEDDVQLPDWMFNTVGGELESLLAEEADAADLHEIDTEILLQDSEEEWSSLLGHLNVGDTSGLVLPPEKMEDAVIGDHDELQNDLPDEIEDDATPLLEDDLDETADWLDEFEELAEVGEAGAIVNEDLPDWITDLAPDLEEGETADAYDDMALAELAEVEPLDWLDELEDEIESESDDQPVSDVAVAVSEDFDEAVAAEMAEDVAEEEVDDAMAWLEELADDFEEELVAEATTAIGDEAVEPEPVSELESALAAPEEAALEDPSFPDLVETEDELERDLDLAEEEPDDALQWLASLADDAWEEEVEAYDEDEAYEEDDELDKLLDGLQEMDEWEEPSDDLLPAEDVAEALQEEPGVDLLTQRLEQLERQALADLPEDIPVDDLELLALTEAATDDVPEDLLADALDWLEQTALAPAEPVEEMEAGVVEDPDDMTPAEVEAEIDLAEAEAEAELTDAEMAAADLVEALEPVAGVDLDFDLDLPETAVADDVDALALSDVPDDPDELMAWLEKLAARQGADVAELPSVTEEDAAAISQMRVPMADELVETAEPEVDLDVDSEIELDTDEIMEAVVAEDMIGAMDSVVDDLADIEAEIDAVHEELQTETAVDDADYPEIEDADDIFDLEMPDDPDEAVAWLERLATEQEDTLEALPPVTDTHVTEPIAPEDELESVLEAYDEDDEMVDWLDQDQEEEDVELSFTDWLEAPDEIDGTRWLQAEEMATAESDADERLEAIDREPLSEMEPEPLAEPVTEVAADLDLESLEVEFDSSQFAVDEAVLVDARNKLTGGSTHEALRTYQTLVQEGRGLSLLIADLETAVAEQRQPEIQRLLGDAYMRNGQLQRALDTYRDALDAL